MIANIRYDIYDTTVLLFTTQSILYSFTCVVSSGAEEEKKETLTIISSGAEEGKEETLTIIFSGAEEEKEETLTIIFSGAEEEKEETLTIISSGAEEGKEETLTIISSGVEEEKEETLTITPTTLNTVNYPDIRMEIQDLEIICPLTCTTTTQVHSSYMCIHVCAIEKF
jgi:hypothetical protein